ncbi:FAD-linked oxidase C-terminal domain-containing protein [Spirillospora sp. NPDC048911]|uniref:FAD-linked oxidase C-terminal domain-containing protein n=1 Tax=Spirillospora sp. NPDC048911 TaxID=3364527 RepID=UPI0037159701
MFGTVPFGRHHATALLRFRSLDEAAEFVPALVAAGATAVELMDAPSLRASQDVEGAPAWLREVEDDAALLVEFRTSAEADLPVFEQAASHVLSRAGAAVQGEFTRDPTVAGRHWRVRKGLLAALGGSRSTGTILLGEDVCVPPPDVAEAARDLRAVLEQFGFNGSIAGHAAAGKGRTRHRQEHGPVRLARVGPTSRRPDAPHQDRVRSAWHPQPRRPAQ